MLPWQIKSIFIIVLFLLNSPRNALFCKGFRGSIKCVIWLASWQNRARLSKLLLPISSILGSKRKWVTTKPIHRICSYSTIFFIHNHLIKQVFLQFYFLNLRKRITIYRCNYYLIFFKITLQYIHHQFNIFLINFLSPW